MVATLIFELSRQPHTANQNVYRMSKDVSETVIHTHAQTHTLKQYKKPVTSSIPALSSHGTIEDEEEEREEEERIFELCLIFTLGGRAKYDFSLDSSRGSFQIQA